MRRWQSEIVESGHLNYCNGTKLLSKHLWVRALVVARCSLGFAYRTWRSLAASVGALFGPQWFAKQVPKRSYLT